MRVRRIGSRLTPAVMVPRFFSIEPSRLRTIHLQKITEGDTVFDAAVRTELLDESRVWRTKKKSWVTLKEIWTRIGKKKPMTIIDGGGPTSAFSPIQREQTTLKVRFDDGREDSISFMSGTLIRRRSGEDYVLTQIDDLC